MPDEKINFVSIDFSTCPEKCELCGAKSELRPYGPFRQWICVDCGMKNKSMTEKRMGEAMDGRGKVKKTRIETITDN
jgi:hypothetical protein